MKPHRLDNINTANLDVATHKLEIYSRHLDGVIHRTLVGKNISWFIFASIAAITVTHNVNLLCGWLFTAIIIVSDFLIGFVVPNHFQGSGLPIPYIFPNDDYLYWLLLYRYQSLFCVCCLAGVSYTS